MTAALPDGSDKFFSTSARGRLISGATSSNIQTIDLLALNAGRSPLDTDGSSHTAAIEIIEGFTTAPATNGIGGNVLPLRSLQP